MTGIRKRLLALRKAGEDRGMLSMVMLVTIIGMGLGALLVPIVVTQSHSTTHTDSRVQALEQAQSGLDAALGLIRNAPSNGSTFGPTDTLPCKVATTAPNNYSVKITYTPGPACTTADRSAAIGSTTTPASATITSTGNFAFGGSVSQRVLSMTYTFADTTMLSSATGGQIRLNATPHVGVQQCIDTTLGTVAVTACDPNKPGQLFVYGSDLTLRLFSNVTGSPNSSCLQAGTIAPALSMQTCVTSGSALAAQHWQLNSAAVFLGSSGTVCLTVSGTTVQTSSSTAAACSAPDAATATWLPTPSVGSGAAGAAHNQLVNVSQFDQCAEAGHPTWPSTSIALARCDQNTDPTKVPWYQKFVYSGTSQQFTVTDSDAGGSSYCLASAGAGRPVTFALCVPGIATQQWTRPTDFTIRDSNGLCLTLTNYTTLVTATCVLPADATYVQQLWNASSASQSVVAESTSAP
jgi:hypothetical protein